MVRHRGVLERHSPGGSRRDSDETRLFQRTPSLARAAQSASGMGLQRRLVLFFIAMLAVVACSAPPTDDVAESSAALSPSPNDQAAYDYFVGKGLTNFQAAGIVGNLDQESQVDPGAVQAGGPGRGIAQWSVGGRWDTDSKDNVIWYAGTQGASSGSLTLQLEFIWYELTTFSGYGLSELRASTNVTDATVAFETYYEGCGQCDQANRIADAEAALKAYGDVAYAAAYVSQSFPLASSALTMFAGQTVPSYIELKNTGTKTWNSSTHLGTSNPRDRVSPFADGTWISTSRLAGVSGSVAPGASFKFTFDLHAPAKTGTYFEYFNVVQEGVAWFSDPGQGGPTDDDLEVQIVVVSAPAPPLSAAAGIKRWVTDPASFKAWKLGVSDVVTETASLVDSYPTGPSMPAAPKVVLASGAPDVWVIDGSERRHVISPASMTAWQFTAATWTSAQVDAYEQGPDWPASPFVFQGAGDAAVYVIDVAAVDAQADGGAGSGAGEGTDGGTDPSANGSGGGASAGSAGAATPAPSDDGGAADNGAAADGSGSTAASCTIARASTKGADVSWMVGVAVFGFVARSRSRRRRGLIGDPERGSTLAAFFRSQHNVKSSVRRVLASTSSRRFPW